MASTAEAQPLSEDDSVSIESNPLDFPVLTEERLAFYEKIHRERTDRMYLGPVLWPPPSPKQPKRRTRRMLVGLETPFPDHGLKRSPTGRVRSWRLETRRKQEAASRPSVKAAKVQKRKAPSSNAPKKAQGKRKLGTRGRKAR